MKLFFRKYGQGQNLIILHGLYGSSDNWGGIAKKLSDKFSVFLPDLRNHGNSPHHKDFSISVMSDDLLEFVNDHNLSPFFLCGHSLGGKIAMDFAAKYPEKVKKLIVIDIAPRVYEKNEFADKNNHKEIINILKNTDLAKFKNRKEVLDEFSKLDKTGKLKFFMAKNIKRNKDGSLSWKININAIADNLSTLLNKFDTNPADIKAETLFIKAENSPFLKKDDLDFIKNNMPNIKISVVKNANHWLHAEKPEELSQIIADFLLPAENFS